mmetsp:Transcript_84655/g.132232  ORF Transcript_84655/g.132232 Transcript_84655/m.132232 type:complete len:741 (-) Transcript_84655:55-2277(-)
MAPTSVISHSSGAARPSKAAARLSPEPLSAIRAHAVVFSAQASHCGFESASAAARVRSAHCEAALAERQQRLKDFQRQCQRRVSQRRSRLSSVATSQAKPMSPPRCTMEEAVAVTQASQTSCERLLQPSSPTLIALHSPARSDVSGNRLASLIADAVECRSEAMCRLGLSKRAPDIDTATAVTTTAPVSDKVHDQLPSTKENAASDLQRRKQSVLRQMLQGKHAKLLHGPMKCEAAKEDGTNDDVERNAAERQELVAHAEVKPLEKAMCSTSGDAIADDIAVKVRPTVAKDNISMANTASNSEPETAQVASSSGAFVPLSRAGAREEMPSRKKIGKANTTSAALVEALSPQGKASPSAQPSKPLLPRSSAAATNVPKSVTLAKDVSSAKSSSTSGSLSNGSERAMRYTSGLLSLLLRAYAKRSRPPPALCACVPQPSDQPPPQIQSDGHLSQAPAWEAYVQRIACPSSHARNCEFSHSLSRLQRQVLILIQEARDPSQSIAINLAPSSSVGSLSRTALSPSGSVESISSISKSQCSVPMEPAAIESQRRIESCVDSIRQQYRCKRVCLLGGGYHGTEGEELPLYAKALAEALVENSSTTLASVQLFSGGRPGVQQTFVEHAAALNLPVVNLVHRGSNSQLPSHALIHEAGFSEEEKADIFTKIGDIYITIGGGPGVSREAASASAGGAYVIPVISSGGASAELALPDVVMEDEALILSNRQSTPDILANTLLSIIQRLTM